MGPGFESQRDHKGGESLLFLCLYLRELWGLVAIGENVGGNLVAVGEADNFFELSLLQPKRYQIPL